VAARCTILIKERANPGKPLKMLQGEDDWRNFPTNSWRRIPSPGWEHSPVPARRTAKQFAKEF